MFEGNVPSGTKLLEFPSQLSCITPIKSNQDKWFVIKRRPGLTLYMGWSLLVTSTWFIVTVLHGSVNMWGIFTVWRYLGRPVENCPLKTHNTINVGDCLHIYAGSNIINDRKQFKLDNHECIILSSFFYSSVIASQKAYIRVTGKHIYVLGKLQNVLKLTLRFNYII